MGVLFFFPFLLDSGRGVAGMNFYQKEWSAQTTNRLISNSMDSFNRDLSTHFVGSEQKQEKNPLLLLAEASISQRGGSGCSVQILNSPNSGYFHRQTNQDARGCPLNSFSITPLPLSESELSVGPLNKDTQHHGLTESVKYAVAESSSCSEPVHPAQAHKTSRAAAQARYFASDKGKRALARYAASDKGKRALARYAASDKGKITKARRQAKYEATEKGKWHRSIANTKSHAYRLALSKGLSEELAREKGEQAAKKYIGTFSVIPQTTLKGKSSRQAHLTMSKFAESKIKDKIKI